jgi:hypothetical protein
MNNELQRKDGLYPFIMASMYYYNPAGRRELGRPRKRLKEQLAVERDLGLVVAV